MAVGVPPRRGEDRDPIEPTTTAGSGVSSRDEAPDVGVTLRGRHVVLQPVRTQDYEALRVAELHEDLVPLWRFQGATPSPEEWVQRLWHGVLAQFTVLSLLDRSPLGLVCVYGANFQHRFAYLAAAKFDVHSRSPGFVEGLAMFISYLFKSFDFRKIYLETNELNFEQFRSALGLAFREEARLREHRYFGGRYWDQYIFALYRESWEQLAARYDHLRSAGRVAGS